MNHFIPPTAAVIVALSCAFAAAAPEPAGEIMLAGIQEGAVSVQDPSVLEDALVDTESPASFGTPDKQALNETGR